MAKSRCPACGPAHKEGADVCRMCGAPMGQPTAPAAQPMADGSVAADRFKAKGLGHFALYGLALGAVIIIGAVALGLAQGNEQVDWVRDNVPFLSDDVDDGWVAFADPDGVLVVDTPTEPEEVTGGFAVTESGDVVRYRSAIGEDYEMTVGFTSGAEVSESEGTATTLDGVAEAFAEAMNGHIISENEPFTVSGHPALDVEIDGAVLPDGPAFATVRLILADGEVIFAETISYQRNPEEHRRMVGSLALTADEPVDDDGASSG